MKFYQMSTTPGKSDVTLARLIKLCRQLPDGRPSLGTFFFLEGRSVDMALITCICGDSQKSEKINKYKPLAFAEPQNNDELEESCTNKLTYNNFNRFHLQIMSIFNLTYNYNRFCFQIMLILNLGPR